MNIFQEGPPQRVYTRTKKKKDTKPRKRRGDMENENFLPTNQNKRVQKKNLASKSRQSRKTKEKGISEELAALKAQFDELAKEELQVIKIRTKQDNVTKKATTLAIENISKDSNRELNEELGLEELFTRKLVLADLSIEADPLPVDDFILDLSLEEDFPIGEPEIEDNSLPNLEDLISVTAESLSESDDDIIIELSSSEEEEEVATNSNFSFDFKELEMEADSFSLEDTTHAITLQGENNNTVIRLAQLIQMDSLSASELPIQEIDLPLDDNNTIMRLAQLINPDKGTIVDKHRENDSREFVIPETDRIAALIAGTIDDIETIHGEQTRTLDAVLRALQNQQETTEFLEFEDNEDGFHEMNESECELSEEDNTTNHIQGDFTTTLKSVVAFLS